MGDWQVTQEQDSYENQRRFPRDTKAFHDA